MTDIDTPDPNDNIESSDDPQPAPDTQATPEPDPEPDDQDNDREPRSAEAKRYRLRLRETEGELQTVRDQLDATRQTIIDSACQTAQLDRRLWDAAGVDITELTLDNGALDLNALNDRAREVRRQMIGGPRPNPQQGTYGSSPAAGTWSQVIQDARRKNT